MGIKKIKDFLEKHAKESFQDISIDEFEGQSIAIDISIYMYQHMSSALTTVCNQTNFLVEDVNRELVIKLWINKTLGALYTWMANGIKPLIVFDGKPCDKKSITLDKRRKLKEDKKLKIDLLKAQLKEDPFLCQPSIVMDLKKAVASYISFTSEEKLLYKNAIISSGIPWIQATSEAEQLCSMLCMEGQVKAVYTKDLDVLCYGCPLTITSFSDNIGIDKYGYNVLMLNCVRMNVILNSLDMTQAEFTDLCIMSECDYNTNIKNVGPARAFKLLKKHKTIENIPMDTSCLCYEFCRNQFKQVDSSELIESSDFNMRLYTTDYIEYIKNYTHLYKSYYQSLK